jgi:polyribonucleotide nucleotidyltransferase
MNIFKDPRLNEKLKQKINKKLKDEYKIPEGHIAESLLPKQKDKIIHAIRFRNNGQGYVDIDFICKATKFSREVVRYMLYEEGFREDTNNVEHYIVELKK